MLGLEAVRAKPTKDLKKLFKKSDNSDQNQKFIE